MERGETKGGRQRQGLGKKGKRESQRPHEGEVERIRQVRGRQRERERLEQKKVATLKATHLPKSIPAIRSDRHKNAGFYTLCREDREDMTCSAPDKGLVSREVGEREEHLQFSTQAAQIHLHAHTHTQRYTYTHTCTHTHRDIHVHTEAHIHTCMQT